MLHEKEINEKWENIIFIPFPEENFNKIITIKKEEINNDLKEFFKQRFEVDLNFENILNIIFNKQYYFLNYLDVSLNLKELFKIKFLTKEDRINHSNIKDFFNGLSYLLNKKHTKKDASWKEMRELFKNEFKNVSFKNVNKKVKFNGFDFPTAADFGFEERMSYNNIKYSIKEQNYSIEDVIFCTTSVYIMNLIEVKQGRLFKELGLNLLTNMNEENLKKFSDELFKLNKINTLF